MSNSKKIGHLHFPQFGAPNFLHDDRTAPKLPNFRPLEMGFYRPGTWWRGPWNQVAYPKTQPLSWENPESFSLFHALHQKLFIFYIQIDTEMHILHSYLHRQDFCLNWNLYISLYCITLFACLTHLIHFVCEGQIPKWYLHANHLERLNGKWRS